MGGQIERIEVGRGGQSSPVSVKTEGAFQYKPEHPRSPEVSGSLDYTINDPLRLVVLSDNR